jgi:hypothetical protein
MAEGSGLNGADLRVSFEAISVREIAHEMSGFGKEMVVLSSALDGAGFGAIGANGDEIIGQSVKQATEESLVGNLVLGDRGPMRSPLAWGIAGLVNDHYKREWTTITFPHG